MGDSSLETHAMAFTIKSRKSGQGNGLGDKRNVVQQRTSTIE
jgi:hypothetical protein